jgi:hypothetical protein
VLPSIGQSLVINEAVNNHFISVEDFDAEFWAWIELCNASAVPLDLSHYYLSNTPTLPLRFRLPSVILPPGGRRLVLFSGKHIQQGTFIHSNFVWDRRQDEMYLYDTLGQLLDFVRVPALPFDHSWGRRSDADSVWQAFRIPTPATPNHWGTIFHPLDAFVSIWPPSGLYQTDSLRVECTTNMPNAQIRYTLDGSLPNSSSLEYKGPFWLMPNTSDTFTYAGITTNPESSNPEWRWRPPLRMPETGNVLRMAVFEDSIRRSPYYNTHYFMGARSWPVGVVSLSVDPESLFDHEKGIYVPGKTYEENPISPSVWGNGNYHNRGRRWERIANIAFFENDGSLAFQQDVGIRIHGGGSRSLPQKSLRLYGRFIYGKGHIPYAFFPEDSYARYDRMILRNGGQGFLSNIFNDILVNSVMRPLQLTQQRSRPVQHFINGEYWGVANLRDYIDYRFIAYMHGIAESDVEMIEPEFNHPDGKNAHMAAWLNFLESTTDMNAAGVYEEMQNYIDLDDFRDYYIARIFSAIFDWPMNNRRLWRHRNGVMRNVFFDSDDAFQDFEANTLEHALEPDGPNWPNAPFSTLIFRKLIENDVFKKDFVSRYESLARSHWHTDRLISIVDSLQEVYQPLMTNQLHRWQFPGQNISVWLDYVEQHREFFRNRHCMMRNHFIERFGLSDTYLYEYDCTFSHLPSLDTIVGRLYPNPNNGSFTIDLQSPNERVLQLEMFNTAGQAVLRRSLLLEQGRQRFDIEGLTQFSPGVYLLRVSGAQQYWQTTFIKI